MKILNVRQRTHLDWLNLFDIQYLDSKGKSRLWRAASRCNPPKCAGGNHSRPDAVVIAAFHTGLQKLVVTKEYRVPLADYEIGFPAGLVDTGETPGEAARRELKEETGLSLTRIVTLGPPVYSSAGLTDESVAMVYVECDGRPTREFNEGAEDIEVFFLSRSETACWCGDPALKFDAKAWLVLSHWAAGGLPCFQEKTG